MRAGILSGRAGAGACTGLGSRVSFTLGHLGPGRFGSVGRGRRHGQQTTQGLAQGLCGPPGADAPRCRVRRCAAVTYVPKRDTQELLRKSALFGFASRPSPTNRPTCPLAHARMPTHTHTPASSAPLRRQTSARCFLSAHTL